MTSHNHNLQAITIICFSYLIFSGADVFSKMLGQHYNVHQILVYTGGTGMIFAGLWIVRALGWNGFRPADQARWHIIRALVVACIPISVIQALQHMPLADYYGISFCAPFLILVFSFLLLHEKIGWRRWLAVVVGFVGVILIAGPRYDEFGIGIAYALAAAFFVALSIITVRKIGPHAPRPHYIFFPFCATFLLNLIALPIFGEPALPASDHLWVFIALIACVIAGHLGFALGHAKASQAAVTAPFLYTQILWGVAFGWLVFGDIPAQTTWIGLIIVVGAGLYSVWREYRLTSATDLNPEV